MAPASEATERSEDVRTRGAMTTGRETADTPLAREAAKEAATTTAEMAALLVSSATTSTTAGLRAVSESAAARDPEAPPATALSETAVCMWATCRTTSSGPTSRISCAKVSQPTKKRFVKQASCENHDHFANNLFFFFFNPVGPVAHADVLLGRDGRSKGCGVVEYQNPEDAQTAIRKLNDVVLMGRPVFVREDRESETRIGFSGGRGGTERRESASSGSRQVFVGNVSAVHFFIQGNKELSNEYSTKK